MVLRADDEAVTTERVGIVVFLLARGRVMTTAEIAQVANVKPNSAWQMMAKLSRCLPLYLSDDKKWRFIDQDR